MAPKTVAQLEADIVDLKGQLHQYVTFTDALKEHDIRIDGLILELKDANQHMRQQVGTIATAIARLEESQRAHDRFAVSMRERVSIGIAIVSAFIAFASFVFAVIFHGHVP